MRSPASARSARLRTALAATLLAALVAACGTATGDPSVAASVNGEEIGVAQLEERFEAVRDTPQLAQQLESDTSGDVERAVKAQILSQLIQFEVLNQAAEELGIEVTQEDIAAKRTEVVETVGGEEAFQQLIEQNGFSQEDVTQQLRQIIYSERIPRELPGAEPISDEQIRQAYEENIDQYRRATARHILVETRQQAEQVLRDLEAGQDFATIAEERSTDPSGAQNGGELPEFGPGQMVPEFEQAVFGAEVGEIVGPVETQFGFHVIEVLDTRTLPLASVRDQIRQQIAGPQQQEAVTTFLQEQTQEADIRVNPRFGEWDDEAAQVTTGDPLGQTEAPAAGAPAPAPAPSE